jgi:hypothetical protein
MNKQINKQVSGPRVCVSENTTSSMFREPICQKTQSDVSKRMADPNEDTPNNYLCMSKTKTPILPGRESEFQRNLLLPENFRGCKNTD